jgi:hypothetical protein
MTKELHYEGKAYKLCDQTEEEQSAGVCAGCAFAVANRHELCGMGELTDHACCHSICEKVWKLC